jgi:2-polyprenyl-3-methyl-5-hydroxy-6-metoxy-1,4-benzoquinol methylase
MSAAAPTTHRIRAGDQRRKALEYTAWLLRTAPDIHSVTDIGCADGVVATGLPSGMAYSGFDIGADIYARTTDPRICYVENFEGLKAAIRASGVKDVVLAYDVLEHTDDFTSLFELALEKSRKYVFVALPNEQNIRVILGMLRGELPGAHGVAMVKMKKGHRHQ